MAKKIKVKGILRKDNLSKHEVYCCNRFILDQYSWNTIKKEKSPQSHNKFLFNKRMEAGTLIGHKTYFEINACPVRT